VDILPSVTNFHQGMAFLSRYRTLRGGDAQELDEVEYNFGRAFQQLGLQTYAIQHYERVLRSNEQRLESGFEVQVSPKTHVQH